MEYRDAGVWDDALRKVAAARAQERSNRGGGFPTPPAGFSWNHRPADGYELTPAEIEQLDRVARMIYNESHDSRTAWAAVLKAAKIAATNKDVELERGLHFLLIELIHACSDELVEFDHYDITRRGSRYIALKLMEWSRKEITV